MRGRISATPSGRHVGAVAITAAPSGGRRHNSPALRWARPSQTRSPGGERGRLTGCRARPSCFHARPAPGARRLARGARRSRRRCPARPRGSWRHGPLEPRGSGGHGLPPEGVRAPQTPSASRHHPAHTRPARITVTIRDTPHPRRDMSTALCPVPPVPSAPVPTRRGVRARRPPRRPGRSGAAGVSPVMQQAGDQPGPSTGARRPANPANRQPLSELTWHPLGDAMTTTSQAGPLPTGGLRDHRACCRVAVQQASAARSGTSDRTSAADLSSG
jgi:hypothetical protein